jgi:hypothetical protein
MKGRVLGNLVLCKAEATPGHRFRQIVVVEGDGFQVIVEEGDAIKKDAEFLTPSDTADVTPHRDVASAIQDASEQAAKSKGEGWLPYA